MRVLVITFEFPPGQGGTGTYAFHICRELARLGHKVAVLAHSSTVPLERALAFDRGLEFSVERFRTGNSKVAKIWGRTAASWRRLRRNPFDVVFTPFPNAAILGWTFRRLHGVPYVAAGHGSEFLNRNPVRRWSYRLAYGGADAVVVNSRFTRGLMEQAGILNPRTWVVPLGADGSHYDPSAVPADGKQNRGWQGRKVLLTVGGLRPVKGHRTVLEAVRELRRDIPEILYVMVGEGRERGVLERAATELGLEEHVRFEGPAEWERLREYYAACDVFVLNSEFESFGLVLVEAALMGKPAVASRVGGIPDVVEEDRSGLLVPPGDPRATAQALKSLLTDPGRAAAMGAYARTRALETFTWERTARRTEEVLRRAAEGKRA